LTAIFELSTDAIALVVPDPWRLTFANSALLQWLGRPAEHPLPWPLEAVLRTTPSDRLLNELERAWRGESAEAGISVTLLSGESPRVEVPVDVRLTSVELAEQRVVGLIMHRVAEQIDAVPAASRRDPLTGLADRSQLLARLKTLLAGDRSDDQRFAVLFIDLNDFKKVNDRHGHMVGDRVLSEVARRLARCIRSGDQIVRYGGDEFVVLIEQVAGWEEFEPVIGRIHAALAEPMEIATGSLTVSASVGAAEVTDAHHTPEDLLSAADRAMYAAKRRTASRISV
jgi:diguanylate cyclase (GGDEF)-like protein